MKSKILNVGLLIIFFVFSMNAMAQTKGEETIVIKSVLACQTCENRITSDLPYKVKGIKTVKADSHTNEITVTYRTDKTTPEDIRKGIASLGYDADDVQADAKAFSKLSEHCRTSISQEKETGKKPACSPGCSGHHH
ncbi:MAG: heavy-metal-associated domain-containing protein [Bacteroidales bacterium]|jgi:copper chaperone CopZ|nr:heavy-metal-associated domain-containing protein [Bacteroidales bacterium]